MADIDTSNLDAGTDKIKAARPALLGTVQRVNSLAAASGSSLVAYTNGGVTPITVQRALDIAYYGTVNAINERYAGGVIANGVADDTAAFIAALADAVARNATLVLPPGTINISAASLQINAVGVYMLGAGVENTIIKAVGDFAQLLELQASSAEVFIEGVTFETTGTTTRCVKITRGQTPHFLDCGFRGNLSGALVFSTGDICQWSRCKWDCNSASTIGLVLDEYNQNCSVDTNSRFGGIGLGLQITKSGANDRVEGLKLDTAFFINTGDYNVDIGDSFLTTITGCVLDQATVRAIRISSGADKVQINGGWFGLKTGSTGVCIDILETAGSGHTISGACTYGGNTGIGVSASASARVSGVLIDGVVFDNHANQSLSLDSVGNCRVVNCEDRGAPTSGSWITGGTHASKGAYTFDNNNWHTAAPGLYDTASSYRFGNDTGIVGRKRGSDIPGSAATSLVISHGLFRAPSMVIFTIEGASLGDTWLTAKTATTFTANWTVSSTPVVNWVAEL